MFGFSVSFSQAMLFRAMSIVLEYRSNENQSIGDRTKRENVPIRSVNSRI